MKRIPSDVGEHGVAYDQRRDDESGKDTGPEAHAAERNEEDAFFSGEVDPCLIGQEGLHSYCDQKARGPNQSYSEGELKGDVHHRI
jgi:hypothetical protein